jgi:hypothetical protein
MTNVQALPAPRAARALALPAPGAARALALPAPGAARALAHPTLDVPVADRPAPSSRSLAAAVAAHPSARRPTRHGLARRSAPPAPRPAPIGVVRFHALGAPVTIRVVASGPERLLARGRARAAELERRWGRPWARGGTAATARLAAAVAARRAADLAPAPGVTLPHTDVVLEADGAAVQIPPDGGGRALLADLVVDELADEGALGAAVQVGRVVRVFGDGPAGPWSVGVHAPWARAPLAQLRVRSGAVAVAGVLDPTMGAPDRAAAGAADADRLLVVAVVTGEAWRAELLAAAVLHAGARDGADLLADAGAVGVLVDARGVLHHVGAA